MEDKMQEELKAIKAQILESLRAGWLGVFDERQQRLIANARAYAQNDPAGIPGHNLMLIIDKMAAMLDDCEPVKPSIE